MFRLALALSCLAGVAAAASPGDEALAVLLQRAGERVEQFFTRAHSLVCTEITQLQPLSASWSATGLGRTVEAELRVSWAPAADGRAATEAQTLRQLLAVNGHKPRRNDWKNCTTPEQQQEERQPLSLLLPSRRGEYAFADAGRGIVDGRSVVLIDYRVTRPGSASARMVDGRDDCISFDIDGGLRGRLWIDAVTYDVVRLDQHLAGQVEIPLPRAARRASGGERSWTMERWDTSMRFKTVRFENPSEALLLPHSLTSLTIVRGAGTPRLRTTVEYRNYRRFLTAGRVIG